MFRKLSTFLGKIVLTCLLFAEKKVLTCLLFCGKDRQFVTFFTKTLQTVQERVDIFVKTLQALQTLHIRE